MSGPVIAKGTKVRLRTENGGDVICVLHSDYRPSYGAWFTGYRSDDPTKLQSQSFHVGGDRIRTVEAFVEWELNGPTDAERYAAWLDRHHEVDTAVLANRACPCYAHVYALAAAAARSVDRFMREQTVEFQVRTHR